MFQALTLNSYADQKSLSAMFKFRQEIFVDRLGWELNTDDEGEKDQFDHDAAIFLVLENRRGQVVASARMLPTYAPSLLADVFPALANGNPPRDPRVWEVTRLAVDHRKDRLNDVAGLSAKEIPGALWCCLMEFGMAVGARNLISVSDRRIEIIMKRAGWNLQRLGPVLDDVSGKIVGECSKVSTAALQNLQQRCRISGPVLDQSWLMGDIAA
ncbi:MAG: GNAT family N-acetyltransferase [Magnetovibrio sp.]|nr:GNAT family N-acetyltransferase [Magnetovibrio sp.]